MTYQTLKYYCNEGLILERDSNDRRIFDQRNQNHINSQGITFYHFRNNKRLGNAINAFRALFSAFSAFICVIRLKSTQIHRQMVS